jgi:hypothetical protein
MSDKHTINGQRARESDLNQWIIVPLGLPEFEIVSQCMGADESIEVQVRARKEKEDTGGRRTADRKEKAA